MREGFHERPLQTSKGRFLASLFVVLYLWPFNERHSYPWLFGDPKALANVPTGANAIDAHSFDRLSPFVFPMDLISLCICGLAWFVRQSSATDVPSRTKPPPTFADSFEVRTELSFHFQTIKFEILNDV